MFLLQVADVSSSRVHGSEFGLHVWYGWLRVWYGWRHDMSALIMVVLIRNHLAPATQTVSGSTVTKVNSVGVEPSAGLLYLATQSIWIYATRPVPAGFSNSKRKQTSSAFDYVAHRSTTRRQRIPKTIAIV